jgi:biotin transport system substrate-specific component
MLSVVILLGIVAVYIPGVTVLYLNLNFIQQKAVTLSTAIKVGALVPLPGDLVKLAVVLALGPPIRERFRRMGGGSGG